ncbi:MAG: M48 family metallopeptidase [Parcubacteria group bacterium]|nr:M48 family metallopeptidase [Parcubacteria group bacterium]
MSTLYSQAESNVRKTWLLITVFLIFIIAFGWLISKIVGNALILYIAVVFSIGTSFVSYWYSDKIVLATTKAKPIEKRDNPELYRIVENLCITAGVPLPRIYVLPETQPNAFATGRNQEHAVVAVTAGLLQRLDRAELEGVIAHELSHVKNKDMLVQTVAVVLAGVIAITSSIFLRFTIFGGMGGKRNNKSGGQGGAIMLALGLVAAILAPIAASLIKMSISRKREFLADASGALLTRYPEGLARALEKISNDPTPMKKASNSTAHLFISSPFKGKQQKNWFTKLFLTHPPAQERIKALRDMRV